MHFIIIFFTSLRWLSPAFPALPLTIPVSPSLPPSFTTLCLRIFCSRSLPYLAGLTTPYSLLLSESLLVTVPPTPPIHNFIFSPLWQRSAEGGGLSYPSGHVVSRLLGSLSSSFTSLEAL